MTGEQKIYSENEVLEIIRQVLFYGTPETYDNGGMYGNMKPTDTRKRAKDSYEKHFIKTSKTKCGNQLPQLSNPKEGINRKK